MSKVSMNKHDLDWAKNFARSMKEEYGRHNSSTDFRTNPTRVLTSSVYFQPDRVVEFKEFRLDPQQCEIGDVCKIKDYNINTNRFVRVLKTQVAPLFWTDDPTQIHPANEVMVFERVLIFKDELPFTAFKRIE